MKKFISLFTITGILILLFSSESLSQTAKNFSFSPDKPKAGQNISVTYNPSGTKLENSESISMLIHAYGKNLFYTDEVELHKEGGSWKGNFSTGDTCSGVVIRFTDGENFDNNGSKCFPIRFFNNDGKFIKYALSGLAMGYYNWFGALGIDRDSETAYNFFNEELSLYPDVMKDILFAYYSVYSKVNKEKADEFLKTQTQIFGKKLSDSEEDLIFLSSLYRLNKETDKYESTKKLCIEKYPKGNLAQQERFMEYYNSKDPVKKDELAAKFKEDFPNSQYLSTLKYYETQALMNAGKYDEVFSALKQNSKASSSEYNSLAWAMYEKDANLKLAKEIAAKGIELTKTENPLQGSQRPPYYSDKQLKKLMASSNYAILDTYGAILLKLGENAEALKYMKEAYELDKGRSSDVNERYAKALVVNGKYDEARTELEKFISTGKSTAEMKNLLKEVYLKSNKNDSGFENYFDSLSKKALEHEFAELKKTMLNTPAPKFSLVDLTGKKISLESLKGKIVIIDFWATWCGPCKASFPGMQKAVNKFANDPNVKFLFINTWENSVEDKKKNAQDFINQNKYTFHVLLDNDNKVIDSYKVDGIPTKFIIDQNGNIRFKAVGFDGNDDKLVNELSTMIAMLK